MTKKKVAGGRGTKGIKAPQTANSGSAEGKASEAERVVGKSEERKQRETIRRAKEKLKGGSDIALFREQLRIIGLKIKEVTADGNCFFRAVADQLEGDDGDHVEYRRKVVEYLAEHEEDFAPFVEDDVPFEKYLQEMREDGTWAGHMELQATSLLTKANICIHKVKSPRWHIRNFDGVQTRTLHLSYHDGEHYNSVRREDDNSSGAALPIHIEADAQLEGPQDDKKSPSARSKVASIGQEESIKRVLAWSTCNDARRARQALLDLDDDVEAAIEFLNMDEIRGGNAESAGEQPSDRPLEVLPVYLEGKPPVEESPRLIDADAGVKAGATRAEDGEDVRTECGGAATSSERPSASRNKPCPCGSKKKFKACCGAAGPQADRPKPALEVSNRARKQSQRLGKASVAESVRKKASKKPIIEDLELDLGALCI